MSSALASATESCDSKEVCLVVEAEVNPDRMEEFLDMIEKNAIGSRKEPGCLRFDVIRSKDNPNKFFFYEVYVDTAAVAFHKEQPHFAPWSSFKASGGTISSVTNKADGWFMP
eukprot:CAMPEP_0171303706 /NCGR_PEP_ID=MMETSP0816-20121228/13290_1 /TAXON_ID=420281 /ORGANISM="Proboscia inermis, Strain CCAP1064/1" /LENGTH=112 /DNA_ID=CAMNT_0011783189 /DNA_START=124 /DNA_END=462 /DNA_ORIENTATION=-